MMVNVIKKMIAENAKIMLLDQKRKAVNDMARYIDADNFRKTMIKRFGCVPCLTDYSEASRHDIPIDDALNLAPTADVVPRAEVAREIFEEIYEDCFDQFGYIDYEALAELKKKYTEGKEERYE